MDYTSWRTTGALFLDEFTDSRRDAIEGLRQPLEERPSLTGLRLCTRGG